MKNSNLMLLEGSDSDAFVYCGVCNGMIDRIDSCWTYYGEEYYICMRCAPNKNIAQALFDIKYLL